MQSIALRTTSVKSPKPHRDWRRRKLAQELDSGTEICRVVNLLRQLLREFRADQATAQQAQFLKDRGFPLLASLEICLRHVRIVPEKSDAVRS
jgi:hypothetical protein